MTLRPRGQAAKSFLDFIFKIPRTLALTNERTEKPPEIPLVIRVGTAGHLAIEYEASLLFALDTIFKGLNQYALQTNRSYHKALFGQTEQLPVPVLRIVSQLASGLDQFAARIALSNHFQLDVVLPGPRSLFERDIRRNLCTQSDRFSQRPSCSKYDPVNDFRILIDSARRVLELDHLGDNSQKADLVRADYEQAASIILSNCDVLLVAIHKDASPEPGGTRWMEEQAERLDIPIIRIPVEQPSQALLIWTEGKRRESKHIFGSAGSINASIFDAALTSELIGLGVSIENLKLGWFEDNFTMQLDAKKNEAFWDYRWNSNTALAENSLGAVRGDVDNDLKRPKAWADHRASAMAELVRGSFIVSMLLSLVAVAGAMAGLIFPDLATAGKCVEVACLALVLWFIHRSRHFLWRSQWLSVREIERCLDQAGWLVMLGRTRSYKSPAHLTYLNLDPTSSWCSSYLRAALRYASFPRVRLDSDYLQAVYRLTLDNLVSSQITYYFDEAAFNRCSEENLSKWSTRSVAAATVAALLYLLVYGVLLKVNALHWLWIKPFEVLILNAKFHRAASVAVAALGTFLPAVVAAFSAMRHHGEYAQIAGRFQGIAISLEEAKNEFLSGLPDRRRGISVTRSSVLARSILEITDVLFQEVQGWNAILRKKEIEPV